MLITLCAGQFTPRFAPVTWLYVLLNALLVGIVAYGMWFAGLRDLGAVETTVISMMEPVFACLAALLLLGQRMTIAQLAGGALLLAFVTCFLLAKPRRACR